MKFNFIQEDFSAGEIAERARGHISSEAFKAGMSRAANVITTQQGSVASRAGLKLLTDGKLAPVISGASTLLDIKDGPYGSFQLIAQNSLLRMVNRWGAMPFTPFLDVGPLFNPPAGTASILPHYVDKVERKLYLRPSASGVSFKPDFTPMGTLAGGDTCTVGCFVAGTSGYVDRRLGGLVVSSVVLTPGWNTFTFEPLATDELVFYANGHPVEIWGLQIYKSAGPAFGGVVWTLAASGLRSGPTLRAEAVWLNDGELTTGTHYANNGAAGAKYLVTTKSSLTDFFYVFFAGSGMSLRYLSWQRSTNAWQFGTPDYEGVWGDAALDDTGGAADPVVVTAQATTPSWMTDGAVVSLKAYQNRLWIGLRDSKGVLKATRVGFGTQNQLKWDYTKLTAADASAAMAQITTMGAKPRLTFDSGNTLKFTLDATTAAFPAAGQCSLPLPGGLPATTTFRVYWKRAATGITYRLMSRHYLVDLDGVPAAGTPATLEINTAAVVALPFALAATDEIWIKYAPAAALATDALDLNLARPAGAVAWIEELRGLLLGTARSERVFSPGPLTIDPATGSVLSLDKYSTHGADVALPAVPVQDKLVFATPGRQRIRSMSQSIATNGGLVADDISILGEHLLAKRIRTMCYLRAPVPRLVFGFDDGTGAIATITSDKMTLAWSRFELGAPYDIYSVSAMDTDLGTELYVSTSDGAVLVVLDVDSAARPRSKPEYPYGAFDSWFTPHVFDAWKDFAGTGSADITGLPASWIGKNVAAVVHGEMASAGTLTVVSDGAGGGKITLPSALATEWTDPDGNVQAQYVSVGIFYPEHRFTTLPLSGGNPVGDSQNLTSRKPQLYVRLVDSYLPLVNGRRSEERGATDPVDVIGARVTGDRRATELNFQRAAVVDVVMDLPLRMEVASIFGGAVMNNI